MMILLSSCIKSIIDKVIDNTNNDNSPDYTLNFYDADTGYLFTQNFLNMPNAAYAVGSYKVKLSSIQLNIGNKANMPNTWLNKLYCTVEFLGRTNPKEIVGTYNFPESNTNLSLKLRNDFDNASYFVLRQIPDSGQLIINYDTTTKKISGEFRKILFAKPPFGSNVFDILNGRFKHIPFEN